MENIIESRKATTLGQKLMYNINVINKSFSLIDTNKCFIYYYNFLNLLIFLYIFFYFILEHLHMLRRKCKMCTEMIFSQVLRPDTCLYIIHLYV